MSARIREIIEATRGGSKGRVVRGAAFAAEFDGEQATDEDKEDDNKEACWNNVSPSRWKETKDNMRGMW